MSVINQMLKDLEQRNPSQTLAAQSAKPVIQSKGDKNTWLYGLLVILIIMCSVLAYFVLHKRESIPETPSSKNRVSIEKNTDNGDVVDTTIQMAKTTTVSLLSNQNQPPSKQEHVPTNSGPKEGSNREVLADIPNKDSNIKAVHTVAPLREAKTIEKVASDKEVVEETPVTKLTIKPSQIDEKSLIEKKKQDLGIAMAANDLEKAQSALSDILTLAPETHESREQLAAIWYGQNDMQQATDLLMQGVALYPQHWSFRLMLAKIYSSTQQFSEALDILRVMPNVADSEYQATLATLAQQNSSFELAVSAYRYLTQRYPSQSRWWLGLAIAHDSLAAFENAKNAYRQAMQQADVSPDSLRFIQNRLIELGD